MGSCLWAQPSVAQALPALPSIPSDLTVEELLGMPLTYFAGGVIAGGVVVGTISAIRGHRSRKRMRREIDELKSLVESSRAPEANAPSVAPTEEGPVDDLGATNDLGSTSDLWRRVPSVESAPAPRRVVEPQAKRRASATEDHPEHAARDIEQVAENYARAEAYGNLKRTRKRGVRAILSERLGNGMLEGLPVIERADGSTADIGTSWWEETVGNTHDFTGPIDAEGMGMTPVTEAPDPMSTAQLRLEGLKRAQMNARMANLSSLSLFDDAPVPEAPAAQPVAPSSQQDPVKDVDDSGDTSDLGRPRRSVASIINSRIATIDASLFPDATDELAPSGVDAFQQALEAMEENMPNVGVTTSADSSGAVAITRNIEVGAVVRPPAPESGEFDSKSIVENMVQEELQRNRQGASRRYTRSRLKVVSGGTTDLAQAREALQRSDYQPKHMRSVG